MLAVILYLLLAVILYLLLAVILYLFLAAVIPKVPWTSLENWSSEGRTFTGQNHFLLDQICFNTI